MKELIDLQLTIFMLAGTGMLIKRIGIISSAAQKAMNDLVIYVILPCNIVKSFFMDFSSDVGTELIKILLVSMGIQALSVIYGRIAYRKQPADHQKCLRYGTICSNAGFMGNPIAEGVFGAYGLLLASVFLIPLRVMMWTEGIATFSGQKDFKKAARQVVTHPCIIACVIGLFFMITGLRPPVSITKTLTYIGNCNTAMSMMIIGMILADMNLSTLFDLTVLKYSVHRLVIIPLIVYLVLLPLPLSATARGLAVLLTAMPAGATTSILSAKYGVTPEFGTKMVIMSTLLSLPTICLWITLLAR